MNDFILIGRCLNDAVLNQTANGIAFTNLQIQAERPRRKDEELPEYEIYNVTFWQKMAEEIVKHRYSDCLMAIKGRLRANNFTKDDDDTIYRCELVGEKLAVMSEAH